MIAAELRQRRIVLLAALDGELAACSKSAARRQAGQRWDRAVEDALAKCAQLLVILSPAAVASTNVMDEVSLALENNKTVVPVMHRECMIPFRLRRLQYVDLTLNYEAGLDRLREALGVPVLETAGSMKDEEKK